MKKRILTLCLAITITLPLSSNVYGATELNENMKIDSISNISVYIDGVEQEYDVAPVIENGTTLVPMRSIFESLGAEVQWIEHIKTVKASKNDTMVEVKIGSYFAKINNETVKLDIQPKIVEGSTMVPLRFVSEAFGAHVEWEADTRTVQIERIKPELEKTETEDQNVLNENTTGEEDSKQETNNGLTYEEAVTMALKQSYKLRNENESIKRTEEVREQVFDTFQYSRPAGFGVGGEDLIARQPLLNLVQTDIGLSMAKRQVTITEEAIAFEVKSAMDEIIRMKRELDFTNLELKNTEDQLELARIKTENGIASEYSLNSARKALDEGEKQKEVLLTSLDSTYLKLNQLIGLEEDKRYELLDSISYEILNVVDLDSHVYRTMTQDPYIWLQEQQVDQAELGLSLYTYNAGQDPYAAKEIDVRTEKNKLSELKSNYDESLRTKYNQIKQVEKQYEVLEVNLDKAEDALNLVRTQYDAGMTIDVQLQEAQLAVERVKSEMVKLVFQHEKLKILFNKPYLAPDYL